MLAGLMSTISACRLRSCARDWYGHSHMDTALSHTRSHMYIQPHTHIQSHNHIHTFIHTVVPEIGVVSLHRQTHTHTQPQSGAQGQDAKAAVGFCGAHLTCMGPTARSRCPTTQRTVSPHMCKLVPASSGLAQKSHLEPQAAIKEVWDVLWQHVWVTMTEVVH